MAKKTMFIAARYALVVAIFYFIGKMLWDHHLELARYFRHAGVLFYGSVAVLAAFLYLQAWIWTKLLNTPVRQLNMFRGTSVYVNSMFAKYLPGSVWSVVGRLMLARKYGATLTAQIKSVYYENLLLAAVAAIYGLLLFVKLRLIGWPAVAFAYGSIWLIYLNYDRISVWPAKLAGNLRRRPLSGKPMLPRSFFFTFFLFYLISHLLMGAGFGMLLGSFGVDAVDFVEATGTFALAWLIGLLSPLPGGLGLREGALVWLLALQLDPGTASQIAIVARVWSLLAELALFATLNATEFIGKRMKLLWQ